MSFYINAKITFDMSKLNKVDDLIKWTKCKLKEVDYEYSNKELQDLLMRKLDKRKLDPFEVFINEYHTKKDLTFYISLRTCNYNCKLEDYIKVIVEDLFDDLAYDLECELPIRLTNLNHDIHIMGYHSFSPAVFNMYLSGWFEHSKTKGYIQKMDGFGKYRGKLTRYKTFMKKIKDKLISEE